MALRFRSNPLFQAVWGESGRELAEDWSGLQKRLAVSFPDDAEIMQISVWDSDRKTSETLANAIVETYLGDVKAAEAETRQYRLELLKGFQRRMEDDLRTRRKTLQQTADTFVAQRVTQGGQHARAADHQPRRALADDVQRHRRIGLLGLALGAVDLRIEKGVRGAQVALAAVRVVRHDALGVLGAVPREMVGEVFQ